MSAVAPGAAQEAATPRRGFRVEEALAAAIMAVLCLITFANVVTRYLTSISLAFTEEISVFLVVVMTFVGAATAFTRGHHLAIAFVAERLPLVLRPWQQRLALACSLAMFAVLAWYGAGMWWDDLQTGVTSPGLGVPQWWYTAWLPLLSVLVALRVLQQLLRIGRA